MGEVAHGGGGTWGRWHMGEVSLGSPLAKNDERSRTRPRKWLHGCNLINGVIIIVNPNLTEQYPEEFVANPIFKIIRTENH